ncbi:MAG: 3-oxoacyl-(acyl-carrier-protein) synthase [Kiritimatiellia bacterium]|jgi:3-oxoacyl-(acyl-carrier-protein) synthase
MDVVISAWGGIWGDELGDFRPRSELPQRKHLKLMERSVQLGVAAVGRALGARPGWELVPAERRGLFVGARPVGSTPDDLEYAIVRSSTDGELDVGLFGEIGVPLVHPLWLVKGLSNNIPGYASAYWNLQGATGNRCEGRAGGLAAIVEAVRAVAEGRVDLAVAGGADSLLLAPVVEGVVGGEGAAFVVVERADEGVRVMDAGVCCHVGGASPKIDLGAAHGAVELCQALQRGASGVLVEVVDERSGVRAWIKLSD